ncbi:jacalin-like lectin domain-containing protein [Tanacetum coccineum]
MENLLKHGPSYMNGKIWDEGDGKVCRSEIHGEPHGSKLNVVTLNYPSEFLVSVSGHHMYANRVQPQLASLAFGTNKRHFGPFGKTGKSGTLALWMYHKFSYEFGTSFAGFYGSVHSGYVNAIGVYIKPVESLSELNQKI